MPLVGAVGWLPLFFSRLSVSSDPLHESSHSGIQDEGALPICVSVFSRQRKLVQESSESLCLELLSWHFYIYSNWQRRSWGQGQHWWDRGMYPPLGDEEGKLNICRTVRVCLKGYVWDHRCVYEVIWLNPGGDWTQSDHCLPKQWLWEQRMGFCWILLLALGLFGERLGVRKAVPKLSLPLLLLGRAASVLPPVTWQRPAHQPLHPQVQFQVSSRCPSWWWIRSP